MEIVGTSGQGTLKCVEQFITQDSTVKGSIDIPNKAHITVDFIITDDTPLKNTLYSKKSVYGPQKFSFTTQEDTMIKYCFTATLANGQVPSPEMKRTIFLHIESGHTTAEEDPEDDKSKWGVFDIELKYLTTVSKDAIIDIQNYEHVEESMNEINQSSKDRVFNFSTFSILVLIGMGIWQI
ncbi:Transmembrane emp24 domain-containing protein 10, partial [Globomyces sp. JEL0801]